ncbi:Cytochrome P450 superfamily protein [Perilla frutescens var. hirtella]|uniref:Cytochrome P450 superfamily protein n=1 Tax=Perilla frutescens var. hirtella TaxID=608512 RepID=A0AAD4JA19_PERFH|nr:Cytochrome P450 superfamily protein [Perilla frutescens var. hirtella]
MEEDFYSFLYLIISSFFLIFLVKIFVHDLWWIPTRIEKHFMKQGIKSPKYEFFLGNLREISSYSLMASAESMPLSHDILPRVLAFFHIWKKIYGSMYLIWFGPTPRLTISDPALIKEIFFTKSEYFEKYDPPLQVKRIEGDGLLNLKGEKWAHHRKIMQPFFYMENLKLIAPIMGTTMDEALVKLSENMSKIGSLDIEIEVAVWFQNLLEHVITKITFGSNYEEGLAISKMLAHQTAHATEAYQKAFIPGYRFLPTSSTRISQRLSKEVHKSLLKIIDGRKRSKNPNYSNEGCPTDLLEVMMRAADESARSSDSAAAVTDSDVVEECKTIFFAGTHTTSSMLTWTAVLLAMHGRWQEEARDEIFRVCGARDSPTKDDLAKLKLVGMIINESVRLYPPVTAMIRRATADVSLNGVHIPQGTELLIPTIAVHHDSALWGDDVHDFNPMRFSEGASRAAEHPMAFIPFGAGTRRCIGQNLAILETKLAFALILRRFSLELAPNYRHAPSVLTLLHPQYGAPILFRKLSVN